MAHGRTSATDSKKHQLLIHILCHRMEGCRTKGGTNEIITWVSIFFFGLFVTILVFFIKSLIQHSYSRSDVPCRHVSHVLKDEEDRRCRCERQEEIEMSLLLGGSKEKKKQVFDFI